MSRTKKRSGPALPPPSRPPRTPWQQERDAALSAKGFTKRDVHRYCESIYGGDSPSLASVRAVLDNRFADERVRLAFAVCVEGPKLSEAKAREVIARYWPADEPVYKGPTTTSGSDA